MRHIGLLVLLFLLVGCLERREHLRVEPDGTVHIEVALDADSLEELHGGDAVPALDEGWLISESIATDAQGRERFRLNARALFGPDRDLPGRYGGLADPLADAVLQFPTTLTIEHRRDGTYYHFRRAYPARAWARIDLPRQVVRKEIEELLAGRRLEVLPLEERRRLVERYAHLEMLEFLILARVAFTDVSPEAPQDVWLAVSAAVQGLSGGLGQAGQDQAGQDQAGLDQAGLDQAALAEWLAHDPMEDPGRDARIEEAVARFRAAMLETALDTLRRSGWYPISYVNRFKERVQQERWDLSVTEDLGDDTFKVSVQMPGDLVGHNGKTASGSTVTWDFAGHMMRDRVLELMVSSRLVPPP